MGSFEVIVRPAVFPDVRPRARQTLPPQDDPDKGFAVIRGQPAKIITLSQSISVNANYNRSKEDHRIVDETRIYQKDDDDNVDESIFIDVDVPKEISMKKWGRSGGNTYNPTGPVSPSNPATSGGKPGGGSESYLETSKYAPAKEADNIEIKKKDVKRKAQY